MLVTIQLSRFRHQDLNVESFLKSAFKIKCILEEYDG